MNADSDKKEQSGRRLTSEPQLEIGPGIFSQDLVFQLVNDCIVPALVEEFLRSRTSLREAVRGEHNEDQL
jgi:hypothetical protein